MSSYVPPHLRRTATHSVPRNTWQRTASSVVQRRKAIVIPKLHGKYVVVRHRNANKSKGNVTFIGGGCPHGSNIAECALRELHEESRKAINRFNFKLTERKNLMFKGNRSKEGVTTARPGGFAENNRKKGIKVNMMYHVFEGNPARMINFHTIKKRFHSTNVSKLPNKYKETTNIMLISNRNLKRMPANQKYFIVNKILKSNLRGNSVNSRFIRSAFPKN
jgi:hypothetical protein